MVEKRTSCIGSVRYDVFYWIVKNQRTYTILRSAASASTRRACCFQRTLKTRTFVMRNRSIGRRYTHRPRPPRHHGNGTDAGENCCAREGGGGVSRPPRRIRRRRRRRRTERTRTPKKGQVIRRKLYRFYTSGRFHRETRDEKRTKNIPTSKILP